MNASQNGQAHAELKDAETMPVLRSNSPVLRANISDLMSHPGVSSLIPFAHYGARKLGHIGIIGISLCFFCIVAMFSANSPLHEQISSQTAMLSSLRSSADNTGRSTTASERALSPRQLVDELPARNDLPRILGQIVTIATASSLSLDQGDYEFSATESRAISSYRLTLPVRGSYPQVRRFIEDTLATIPFVALESLRVERNEVSDQIIAADLEFSVLVGNRI